MTREELRHILREEVLTRIGRKEGLSDIEVYQEIDRAVLRIGRETFESLDLMKDLRQDTFNAIRRFGLLEKYLNDERVTEIMIIGSGKVFIERDGRVVRTGDCFYDEEEVRRLIDRMIAPVNRMVNESRPIADSRLPDGSRVHIVLPPVSLEGPVITVRKFQKGGMTIERLAAYGEFPQDLIPHFRCFVEGRYSVLISGATNSGKSSLLNALGEYIGREERIITIEDSAELQLFHIDNLVRLESRDANVEGENEVSMKDLIKASLRMRPDRIIVGEVRGEEAMSMLQALSTGHRGSLSSVHANSCRDALRRLETMVLMGLDMPLRAVQGLIASSIEILVHLGRLPDGRRVIKEICELVDYHEGEYELNPLFFYRQKGTGCSSLRRDPTNTDQDRGRLLMVNRLKNTEKLEEAGLYEIYEKAVEQYQGEG